MVATSVQAQTLVEAARYERERQAGLRPKRVMSNITAGDTAAQAPAPPPSANSPQAAAKPEPPKPPVPKIDPVKEYNDQLTKLRTKVRDLQDQETALQLQIGQLNTQIYAPVVDQAAKDQALAQAGQAQQKLMAVRTELDQTKKTLDALQLQGPPKEAK